MLSLQMGGNLLKNLKGVRINLESVQKSCRKNSHLRHSFATQFSETLRYKGVLDHTPRHRSLIGKGGQLFALVCFRETHKGVQRIYSTENKGK